MDMLQSCQMSNPVPKRSVQLARQKGAVSKAHLNYDPVLIPHHITAPIWTSLWGLDYSSYRALGFGIQETLHP